MKNFNIEEHLQKLGINLPEPPLPVATYKPAMKTGNLIFISGQSCVVDDKFLYIGKVGKEVSLEQGYQAARIAAINCLAILKKELGTLDRVEKVVKVFGIVNSAAGFNQHPKVINGASELLIEVFGNKGYHARTAIGTNELPFGIPVEVEMIFEVK